MSADITVINPLGAPLHGTVHVPGDKSISHRVVLFSAMAQGTSKVAGVLDSQDVRSSLAAVSALGGRVEITEQVDESLAGTITGWGANGPCEPQTPLDCGNSGTTVRLLMGILAPWDISVELTGDSSLCRRPMRRIAEPLEMMGATFELTEGQRLPLVERGTSALRALEYEMPVSSAQLKTAILLAGTRAQGTTVVIEPTASRNHTELMLPDFGIPVTVNENRISVAGPALLHAHDSVVPGDPSSAAFIACAALLKPESDVVIDNISLCETRIGFVRVLERMGACLTVDYSSQDGELCGSLHVTYTENLHACEVKADEIASLIDEIPVLALVAAHAQGTTVFHEVGELRVKETDRFAAIIEGLELLGVHAWEQGNDLFIEGNPDRVVPADLEFDAQGDHRLAMTWALVGLCGTVSVGVKDFEAVAVSYPGFLADMQQLGS